MNDEGASKNEQLLYAARTDNEDMIIEIFNCADSININCTDSLGNTPLHLAVSNCSYTVLEHILSHDECDVDPQNKLEGATPLHLALKIEDSDVRLEIVESLLDAGADTSIKDKQGYTVISLLGDRDPKLRDLMRENQAYSSISPGDIANDDDNEPGSGSEGSSE